MKTVRGKKRILLATAAFMAGTIFCGCGERSKQAYLENGMDQLRRGNNEAAAELLEKAVRKQPKSATTHCNLGIARWNLQQSEQAVESLQKAAELSENDPRVLEFLGHVLTKMKKTDEAREVFNKIPGDSARALTSMAVIESADGEYQNAESLLSQALELDPDYPPALYNLALLLHDRSVKEDRDKVVAYFQKYIELAGNDPHTHKARELLRQIKAEITGEQAAGPSIKPADSFSAAVKTAIENDEFDKALETLKQSIKKDPRNSDALWELALLYEHIEYSDSAARIYRDFEKRFPNDPRLETARRRIKKLAPAAPAHPAQTPPVSPEIDLDIITARKSFNKGVKCYCDNDLDGAIAHYKRALELDTTFADASYNLGLAYKAKNSLDPAKTAFIHALKLNPDMFSANYMLGVVYHELKDPDKAIEHLNKALKIRPDYSKAHFVLGYIYLKKNRHETAKIHLNRCIELAPNEPHAKKAKELLE